MRAIAALLNALALAFILASLLPSGNHFQFCVGAGLLLTAAACAIRADNTDIRFGRFAGARVKP